MGQNLFDVSGKKVIVTGGTRGLGLGMAEAFCKPDAKWQLLEHQTRCLL